VGSDDTFIVLDRESITSREMAMLESRFQPKHATGDCVLLRDKHRNDKIFRLLPNYVSLLIDS